MRRKGMMRSAANFAALSPLVFVARAAAPYLHRIPLIDAEREDDRVAVDASIGNR